MLTRFRYLLRSPVVGRICLQCIVGLILILVLPCALDGHNHHPCSIESSQTHFASCSDLLSVVCMKAETELHVRAPVPACDGYRFPTKHFFITCASSSYL